MGLRHRSQGRLGRHRAAEAGMRPDVVVVALPCGEDGPGMGERCAKHLIEACVGELPIEVSAKAFRVGLPGAVSCQDTCRS
jgi:hypothetical protein